MFGGDTDNWMWPRHTGDFAFYRAYVGADGKPTDYSSDNLPFDPKNYLSVSAKGAEDGDFVMVAGYLGRTNRYRIVSYRRRSRERLYLKLSDCKALSGGDYSCYRGCRTVR